MEVVRLVKGRGDHRQLFDCPYFGSEVELTAERERHILDHHPELNVILRRRLRETLLSPDAVRASARQPNAVEFLRWYPVFPRKMWVVVVVITDLQPSGENRHWIITAYVTSKDRSGGPR